MKVYKKGAIVGAIWGLISGIYLFMSGLGGFAGQPTPRPLLGQIFSIPTYIAFLLPLPFIQGSLLNFIIPLIFSILIGALIGTGVGYLIDRYKSKK